MSCHVWVHLAIEVKLWSTYLTRTFPRRWWIQPSIDHAVAPVNPSPLTSPDTPTPSRSTASSISTNHARPLRYQPLSGSHCRILTLLYIYKYKWKCAAARVGKKLKGHPTDIRERVTSNLCQLYPALHTECYTKLKTLSRKDEINKRGINHTTSCELLNHTNQKNHLPVRKKPFPIISFSRNFLPQGPKKYAQIPLRPYLFLEIVYVILHTFLVSSTSFRFCAILVVNFPLWYAHFVFLSI